MKVLVCLRTCFFIGLAGCGTTGGDLVQFTGGVGGPKDAAPMLSFTTGLGWNVTLDRAELHLGALYLNQDVPLSGAEEQSCVLPGIYVAQIFGPLDVDLLSPAMVAFPNPGEGTQTEAHTAEVWLLEGDINRSDDSTVILDVAGTAVQDAATFPFEATVTIGANRAQPPPNVAMPGANPICHQRIVSRIVVDITPTDGGDLSLRVDPRGMFDGVDFSMANQLSTTPPLYQIPDENGGVGGALFKGLLANTGVYDFAFSAK